MEPPEGASMCENMLQHMFPFIFLPSDWHITHKCGTHTKPSLYSSPDSFLIIKYAYDDALLGLVISA